MRLADDSRDASNLLNQIAEAARDLNATRLADIVRRMEEAKGPLDSGATACRDAATGADIPTTTTG